MYSDGVSDNLFIRSVAVKSCLTKYLGSNGIFISMSAAADCIAIKAYHLGKDKTYESPFKIGAREAGMHYPDGGKHDDVTVTIAQVFDDEEPRKINDYYRPEKIFLYTGEVGRAKDIPAPERDFIITTTDL